MMSTSPSLPLPSEQLCYVHCNICDTVLAVSVPCSSLFKTVTVRCGHCTNLLPVNLRSLLLAPPDHLHLAPEISTHPVSDYLINRTNPADFSISPPVAIDDLPKPPSDINKPPEKRQRVPSAYNRFIKDEIQRIKAGNPEISHREAFSAAAKNWAHFPHIQFGLLPDQSVKITNVRQQESGETVLMKDGFFSSANVGLSPF